MSAKKKAVLKKKKPRISLFVKVERWHARDKCWDISFRQPTKKELQAILDSGKY